MRPPFLRRAAGTCLLMTAAACASAPAGGAVAGPRDTAELEALFHARVDSARLRYTEADVRFMTDMIHHHAQAVEMASLAPQRARHPAILTLAARILSSQLDEIAIMQQWLRDRGLDVPDGHTSHGHGGHAAPAHAVMPGMLAPGQMNELSGARGAAFDELFLQYMIQHHRGAVVMVHQLFANDGAAQDDAVFRFASDVQVDQRTEIARMERMLAAVRSSNPNNRDVP